MCALPLPARPGTAALSMLVVAAAAPAPVAAQAPAADAQRIVVTAARHAMLAIEAPATLTVVTRSEIEARGAGHLLDAMRGEVGLTMQGRAIGGRQVLGLRGLDSKHTLFLVDGRRIGASDGVVGHSDFQYDWVAVEDIERIEIVRGPMSVLYGSEALGGVVNVITRQGGDTWRGSASAEGRRAEGGRGGDGHRLAARVDGPLAAGLTLRAGAGGARTAAVASAVDPLVHELEGRDKSDAWLGLAWQAAPLHRVEAEHRVVHERRWADARERSGARRLHQTHNDIDRTLTSLAWEAQWSAAPAPTTQLRGYRSTIDVDNTRTAGVAANPPQRIDEHTLEGQARADFGAQALTAGFEARNEALHDPGLPGGRSLAQHRSLFVQDEWSVQRGLRLTLGLRHDRHQLFGSEWSPRAYAVWQLGEGWTAKGGYSHGFKAPNLKQIVPGARREGPNVFLGNASLRPERSDGVELALGRQHGGTEVQLAAFAQRVEDLIEVQLVQAGPAPGTGTYTYENLARARLSGLEAELSQRLPGGGTLAVGYTYLEATDGSGRRLDKRPRHSANVRLGVQRGPWSAGLRVEHASDQRLPASTVGAPSQAAPAVTLLGAHVQRSLPHGLTLTLGVDNLTDVHLAEKSPLFQQVEPPRTWRVGLRGRW
ncbi:MAG: TonB-dependent receptor [Rubrivivax sp.]|nr:TonB-dependent receptor [Rubrivivax sp.]